MQSLLVTIREACLALAFAINALYRAYFSRRKQGLSLQDRIDQSTKNLKNSMAVILEIENEIINRSHLLDKVRSDAQRHEQLRQLNETQNEAVSQTIRLELVRGRWFSIVISGVITIVVAVAIFVTGLIVGGI